MIENAGKFAREMRLAGSPHAGGRMASPILAAVPGGFGWRILGEPPALGVADLVESVVQAVVR
jgi:hypothetical protein